MEISSHASTAVRQKVRCRDRQVEEVSNRLTEDGSSKFEKPRRKKVAPESLLPAPFANKCVVVLRQKYEEEKPAETREKKCAEWAVASICRKI